MVSENQAKIIRLSMEYVTRLAGEPADEHLLWLKRLPEAEYLARMRNLLMIARQTSFYAGAEAAAEESPTKASEALLMGEAGKAPPDVVVRLGLHGPIDERVEQLINRAELLRAENAELREEKQELEGELRSYRSGTTVDQEIAESAKEEARKANTRLKDVVEEYEAEQRRADRAEDKVRALEWALVELHKRSAGSEPATAHSGDKNSVGYREAYSRVMNALDNCSYDCDDMALGANQAVKDWCREHAEEVVE